MALSTVTNRHSFPVLYDFKIRSYHYSPTPQLLVSEILFRARGRTVYQLKDKPRCKIMNSVCSLLCRGKLANVHNYFARRYCKSEVIIFWRKAHLVIGNTCIDVWCCGLVALDLTCVVTLFHGKFIIFKANLKANVCFQKYFTIFKQWLCQLAIYIKVFWFGIPLLFQSHVSRFKWQ